MKMKKGLNSSGVITPMLLVFIAIFFIFSIAVMNWSLTERKNTLTRVKGVQALQVAEAGVDYYKWHLNHDDEDFKDGNDWCCNENPALSLEDCGGVCGPYIHEYEDYDGVTVGEYSLLITPASETSSIIKIDSTGYNYENSDIEKTVRARLGKMSLARFSFLSNSPIWIGEGESTYGPVHSNGGIRFDGTCNAEVTSAVEEYDDSTANHDFTGTMPGIWGSDDPEVQSFWSFPEPEFDFDLFTLDMAAIRTAAQDGGLYFANNGLEGYRVIFKEDGTIDIYDVDKRGGKVKYYDVDQGIYTEDWESPDHDTFKGNYPMPDNGVMFVEDSIWVEGTVNGRVTLAVSNFEENPTDYARVIINDNINYLARDGEHVLAIMSEGDILVPRHAPTDLTIDAIMLSQKGHVYRRVYNANYKVVNGTIEVYGGIITDLFWTWSWVDNDNTPIDGYSTTVTIYDNDLLFSPPPMFPTEDNFNIISWEEI